MRDRGTVRGKVKIGEKALTMGSVLFVTSDNRSGTANIKEDGTYEMTDAPVGDVNIAIIVPQGQRMMGGLGAGPGGLGAGPGGKGPPGGMMAPGGGKPGGSGLPNPKDKKGLLTGGEGQEMTAVNAPDPSKIVKIPERYEKPETSGLTFTVIKGEQTHDITLTP